MPPSTTVYDKHVLPAGRQVRVWTLIVKLWSGHFLSLLFVQENMKRETTKISVVRIRKRWNLNKTIYDILPEHKCIYMWKNKSSSQHWCCTYIKVWLMSNKWSICVSLLTHGTQKFAISKSYFSCSSFQAFSSSTISDLSRSSSGSVSYVCSTLCRNYKTNNTKLCTEIYKTCRHYRNTDFLSCYPYAGQRV